MYFLVRLDRRLEADVIFGLNKSRPGKDGEVVNKFVDRVVHCYKVNEVL